MVVIPGALTSGSAFRPASLPGPNPAAPHSAGPQGPPRRPLYPFAPAIARPAQFGFATLTAHARWVERASPFPPFLTPSRAALCRA